MRKFRPAALLLFLAAAVAAPAAEGQAPRDPASGALVADLSEDLIAITTGFTGTDVLLFGATEGAGEIIVVVRGPESQVVVRRKARVAGVWLNADSLTFDKVPGFYHVAASGPVADLLPERILQREQIGPENLAVEPPPTASQDDVNAYTAALIRNKQRAELFNAVPGTITFRGERLFRTQVELPSNVPTGAYAVTVHLIDNGSIVERTETVLQVRKIGFEAGVFEFANKHAPLYGAIAILIALAAGWFAGVVFRNV